MDAAHILGYEDSPNFLLAEEDFPHAQELGYILRKAKAECGLHGVYTLRPENDNASPIPVLYFCQANTETEANQIHKRVWNQGIVPFVLVQTPSYLRLYSGFCYKKHASADTETDGILRAAIAFNEVLDQLAAFQAYAIDAGVLWKEWGEHITPETRVDWTLLKQLEKLDAYLQEHGVSRALSHALIGKFVYFRYLQDRNILSERKLAKWGIHPAAVFSRDATLNSFLSLDEQTHKWLNGSIFPVAPEVLSAIEPSLFQLVAGVFSGDTVDGQLHLDFGPYDFSFIPIETLSVIYEQFLHLPEAGQNTSRGRVAGAYYTPLPLIAFMQEELERKRPLTRDMKILDPSCGSGSFLVQCYRRLIEKQLQQEKRPLRPSVLREILTKQLFGVDRDGDACRVAELSLILTLLDYVTPPDLEGTPNFQLPSLRDTNIFEANFFDPDSAWAKGAAPKKFDWIIGNPPWVSLSSQNIREEDRLVWQWMQTHSHEAPTGGNQVAEAFVWKVLPYLGRDGVAGLVLPAMTLFKKESTAFRKHLFARVRTWCVANFANLAEALFAGRSRRPALALFFQQRASRSEANRDESILTYAPLIINQEANRPSKPGRRNTWSITINAAEIQEVSTYKAVTGEMLPWKLAMWGCFRDGKLLEKVARQFPTFLDFARSHSLDFHQGFELKEKSAQPREPLEAKPELEGEKRANFTKLRGCGRLFVFPKSAIDIILKEQCNIRVRGGLAGLRVSYPPHILVDEARRFAVYSDEFIAVPAGQIGITSSAGKESLLKALSLYLSSDFVIYQQFFTTSQWGISTSIATLDSLKNLPVPLDKLSQKELDEWAELRDILAAMSQTMLEPELGVGVAASAEHALAEKTVELNDRVLHVLGLRESERILIRDFVTTNMQCIQGKVTEEALRSPSEDTMQLYLQRLKQELDTFVAGQSDMHHEIIAIADTYSAMLAIRLTQADAPHSPLIRTAGERTSQEFTGIRERLKQRHSQWIYFNRNLRIYDHNTIYCFKPMQAFHWTQRQAILDAGEVIAETLAAEEK